GFGNRAILDAKIAPAAKISFLNVPAPFITPSVRPRNQANGNPYNLQSSVNANSALMAVLVTDAAGNPQPGATVTVSIEGDNSPAGHDPAFHSPSRVHGWIFADGQQP